MRPLLALLCAALPLLSACAAPRQTAPLAPLGDGPDVNLVGTFQYQMSYHDPEARISQMVTGRIVIDGEEGNYRGEITGTGGSPYPITYVQVSRNEAVVQARSSDGPITLRLAFIGDSFTGLWEAANGLRHTLRGSRR
jgi:hypothetical protein